MLLLRKHITTGLLVLAVLMLLKAGWDLSRVLLLEASGAIDSDALLYMTVGRGLLNGLTPWLDLFESKPPVMFLIATLSLGITGTESLALLLQVLIVVALPLLLGFCTWQWTRGSERTERWMLVALAITMGVQVMLYLEERAGGIQAESFGVFAVCLYAWLLLRWSNALTWRRILTLGALMAVAIETKEPFILMLFATALLTAEHPKMLLRSFVLPLLCAGIIAVAALFVLGWLPTYTGIYLPSMLGGRIHEGAIDPLWVRGFTAGRVFGNLTLYYTAPPLGWLLAACWLATPLLLTRTRPNIIDVAVTVVGGLVAYVVLIEGFLYAVLVNAWRSGMVLKVVLPFLMPTVVFGLLCAAFAALLFLQWRRRRLWNACAAIIALYVSAMTVGIASYSVNHFAFAVPVFFTLLLLFVRHASNAERRSPWILWPVAACTLLAVALYRPSEKHLDFLRERRQYSSRMQMERSRAVDALLDSCDVDRYGSIEATLRVGFTRHSPLGPLLMMNFFRNVWPQDHPLFDVTRRRIAEQAGIVLAVNDIDDPVLKTVIEERFTTDAPPCAAAHMPIEGLTVYFRKA